MVVIFRQGPDRGDSHSPPESILHGVCPVLPAVSQNKRIIASDAWYRLSGLAV